MSRVADHRPPNPRREGVEAGCRSAEANLGEPDKVAIRVLRVQGHNPSPLQQGRPDRELPLELEGAAGPSGFYS
eukprot:2724595-Alexandrium_andersonii.AAC.1